MAKKGIKFTNSGQFKKGTGYWTGKKRVFTKEHLLNLGKARKLEWSLGKRKGHAITEDVKIKMSKANKGKIPWNKGKKCPQISKANKGRKLSEEARLKCVANATKRYDSIKHKFHRRGIPLSIETRKRMSEKMKGKNSSFWKGGLTNKNAIIRSSLEYRLWRESIFARDNYTCIWCFKKGGWNKKEKRQIILNADHIKPFSKYPELRFAIDNGRTLCVDCHKNTDTFGGKSILFKNNIPKI